MVPWSLQFIIYIAPLLKHSHTILQHQRLQCKSQYCSTFWQIRQAEWGMLQCSDYRHFWLQAAQLGLTYESLNGTEHVGVADCTQKELGANPGLDISYPIWGFLWFSSVPPGKYWDVTLIRSEPPSIAHYIEQPPQSTSSNAWPVQHNVSMTFWNQSFPIAYKITSQRRNSITITNLYYWMAYFYIHLLAAFWHAANKNLTSCTAHSTMCLERNTELILVTSERVTLLLFCLEELRTLGCSD
jgi:hypothetical protein